MVFGVTPSKVGWTEEVRGAPATGQLLQSQAFKERAIFPIMEKIAWFLTEEIVHAEFGATELKFEFVEEFSLQDKLLKAQIHQYETMGQWKTVEEVRKEEGLETNTEGNANLNNDPGKWRDIIAGLQGKTREDYEAEQKKKLFDELSNHVREHIKLNSTETTLSENPQEEIKNTFNQLKTEINTYIGKSVKNEIKKVLTKERKYKKERS
jgi:hypothetical protein